MMAALYTQPMRYLVTGGAGFVGSHLVARLLQRGEEVVVLDDLSTGSGDNLARCRGDPAFSFVHGSATDRHLVADLVSEVDAVYHLAAVVGVRRVVARPRVALRDNVLGAQAVLDAAARHRRATLITSSSEVYGHPDAAPLAEDATVRLPGTAGRWAYARSKLVAEAHAAVLHRAHGLHVVVARLFNTVGPGQTGRHGMVLPRFVEQALAGRDLTVYGDGQQSRCFCHVDDVVDALTGLLHEPAAAGEIVNVGSQQSITIAGLAELVIQRAATSSRVRLVPYDEVYPSAFEDVRRRVPDTAKVRRLLGWEPHRDLDATVRHLVAGVPPTVDASRQPGLRPLLSAKGLGAS